MSTTFPGNEVTSLVFFPIGPKAHGELKHHLYLEKEEEKHKNRFSEQINKRLSPTSRGV